MPSSVLCSTSSGAVERGDGWAMEPGHGHTRRGALTRADILEKLHRGVLNPRLSAG
jgi:hypothetical protein